MNIVLNGNMNESSGKAGKGFYPNTELGIDLKLMTKEPGRMAVGEYLDGAITHDEEDHFTFVQNDSEKKMLKVVQRNPHVYEGKYINVNRKKDGTLYPTLTARSSQSASPSRTSAREPPTSCASLAARVMTDKRSQGFLEEMGTSGVPVTGLSLPSFPLQNSLKSQSQLG